jgi:hypothetical protein
MLVNAAAALGLHLPRGLTPWRPRPQEPRPQPLLRLHHCRYSRCGR